MQISLLLDIIISINTSYFIKGTLIVSRKKIALKYFKGWFWLDILSSFPYNWFISSPFQAEAIYDYSTNFSNISQVMAMMRMLRVARALKLIKIIKAKKILSTIEDTLIDHKISMSFIFMKLITFMILVAHWVACMWHFSAVITSDSEPVTWLKIFELSIQESSQTGVAYVTALYWAFTTMATVGYGDIHPYSSTEMVIGIVTMASSSTIFAYILGTVSSLINTATSKETSHREIIIAVNRYMKKTKLPSDLQFRVRRYLDHIFRSQNKSDIAEENIMQMLSLTLKDEIYTHLHGDIIESCNFFKSGGLSGGILSQIHRIMKFEAFAPNDSVFNQKETSRILYFILSGQVDLHHGETNYSYITLQPRTSFGEIGFFAGKPRTASAKCKAFTEFFSVVYDDFMELISGSTVDVALMDMVRLKCEEDDYSILQISCYLCSKLGHIASSCKLILFNLDREIQKRAKLADQENRSKIVSVNKSSAANEKKKRHNIKVGIKHFRKQSELHDKIKEFSMKKEDSLSSKDKIQFEEETQKRYSFIYNITESSHESDDEYIREAAFNMNLLKKEESSED